MWIRWIRIRIRIRNTAAYLPKVPTTFLPTGTWSVPQIRIRPVLRIRIRDPGSGAFLTPGSGIRNRFFPDPGSRISDPGSRIPDPKPILLRV